MMKRLIHIYAWLLLIVFVGVVVYTPLSVWLGTIWPGATLWFKSWKELMLLVAAVLGVVIVTRRHIWRELFDDWVIRLIALYVALHLITAVFIPHSIAPTLAGLAADLRYILYFGLVYVLMRIAPDWRRPFLRTGAIGSAIVVGFATLETLLPRDLLSHIGYSKSTIVPYLTVDQNPDFIRYGSTLRGPNPLGAYVVILLTAVVALGARGKLALRNRRVQLVIGLLVACSLVALWVSYSRSATIGVVVGVGVIVAAAMYRRLRLTPRDWLLLAGAMVLVALSIAAIWKSDFVSNIVLHENPKGGSSVSSNDGHAQSLLIGMTRLAVQPFGAGIGSTGSASLYGGAGTIIENQYLFVAHETGWLGLILFLELFVLILIRAWHRRADWLNMAVFASGLGLAVVGVLLPVWADDTISIVWWGLAALALGSRRGN